MSRVTLLILVAALCGCSHMVPSVGFMHMSDPSAGSNSPNPDRNEIQTNFLGGGVTLEFKDTDVHLWLGGKNHNVTFEGSKRIGLAATVIVSHKFRRSGWQ